MNDFKNNQSISRFTDQLIRYYKTPFRLSRQEALNAVFNKIDEQQKAQKRQKLIFRRVVAGISVAAVLAVMVAFWFFTATVKISTDEAILTYRLPDDSRIVLKHDSEIRYKRFNWNRNVVLAGEAYFEVKKGEGFQVKTKLGDVQVLGTRFLVSDQNEKLSVLCFEGKVKTEFKNQSWILEPGTQFSGENEEADKQEFEEDTQFPDFAKFQASFTNENVINVIKEVEHFFNVDIEIITGRNKSFSGMIQTGSLENTLEIICGSLQLNYRFTESNKIEIFK